MAEDTKVPFLRKVTEFDKGGIAGQVDFVLGNGQNVTVAIAEMSEANKYHAMVHGISQKMGDALASLSKDKKYGEAVESLTAGMLQLYSPEWNREREGGESKQGLLDLIEALVKIKKQPEEIVSAAVNRATPETLKKWMGNGKVKAAIADIRAKRLTKAAKESDISVDEINLDE